MQFIFSPIWGGVSDRSQARLDDRRDLQILAQLLFGFSIELWMLIAVRILAGSLSSATLPTAMAYMADSTSERDRSGGIGIIGAAMDVGMVLLLSLV